MMQYWNNLNDRERLLLSLGLSIVAIYLIYLLIYAPLSKSVHHKSLQLLEKQDTLTWMKKINGEIQKETPAELISNTKLLSLVDSQLREGELKNFSHQLQQTNSGEIQLSFDEAPFNAFLAWLWSLQSTYSIALKQLNLEKTNTPGMIKLNLIISTTS